MITESPSLRGTKVKKTDGRKMTLRHFFTVEFATCYPTNLPAAFEFLRYNGSLLTVCMVWRGRRARRQAWSRAMSGNRDSILPPLEWLSVQYPPVPAAVSDWLMELGSMTRRFERHCGRVHVEPQRECFVTRDQLGEEAEHLPDSPRYWLREIVLLGDNQPWLLGRTVIPQETLTGPDLALVDLGTLPLGRYLFSSNELTRDYIHMGRQESLWARRSRLRLAGKPLLLTELFLPASPLYAAESTDPE
jgi:chorismate--pyruvate lyase